MATTTLVETTAFHRIKIEASGIVDSKDEAYFVRALVQIAAKAGPLNQAAWACALLNIRNDRAQRTVVDLAHEIVMRQVERAAQFGQKLYPFSEKQCEVIARAIKEY